MSRSLERAREWLDRGEIAKAEAALAPLLALRPRDAGVLQACGLAAVMKGDAAGGAALLARAAAAAPLDARIRYHLAEALHRAGDAAGAEDAARRACALDSRLAEPWNLIGVLLLARREHAGAIAHLRAALDRQRRYPDAMLNLAVACNRTGEHALARDLCEMLLRLQPGNGAALVNLGMAEKGLGDTAAACDAFRRAGDLPMARFNLGHTLLLGGDLAAGLPLYEARLEVTPSDPRLGARWDGAPAPDATLLLQAEQGLGDVLLMSRFFAPLAERFARVLVHAPEPLARLLATLDPRLVVVTSLAGQHWDVWCPMMSLPFTLGITSLAALPREPWMHVEAAQPRGTRPRVGINWAGNPLYAYDAVRSTSLATFAPLLGIAEVEWVSLHRGVREAEAAEYGLAQPLADARDFLDTARVIAGLDLVISTETAIPNLSGAMGVPTCVVTVRDGDWRWRGWYASVEWCPQQASGNWFGPLAQVAEAVARLLAVDTRAA